MIINFSQIKFSIQRLDRFARMTGISKGVGFENDKYVKGECVCDFSQLNPFWVPKDLLRRSGLKYLCPHCGLERAFIGSLDELKELQYRVKKE